MLSRFLVFFGVSFLVATVSSAQCVGTPNFQAQTTPAGLTNFMVLSSEQTFNDSNLNTFDPIANPAINGDRFDIDIMGRDVVAQRAQRQLAVDYFINQFGVNFSTSVNADTNHTQTSWTSNDGNWQLFHYTLEPRYNQRIVYSGGETVPTDGWVVNQGFYRMMAISSTAATTSGAWGDGATRTVQQFTFADFGEMRIAKRIPCSTSGFQNSTLDLNYESIRPTFPDILAGAYGSAKGYQGTRANIDYNIYREASALTGTARGRVELKSIGSNNYTSQVRMVLKLS